MHRTSNAFSVLQAIAAIAALAITLWSLGLPSLRFAEAANVGSFSVTLSDSAPGQPANQTIVFVTPSGMSAGETTLTFETGDFGDISSLLAQDLDLEINGVNQSLTDGAGSGGIWGVTAGANTIDIESGTSTIGSNATVTIEIGTNATFGGAGSNQITNPATSSTSYEINVAVGTTDTGETRVFIIDEVTVSATVETIFEFEITGVTTAQSLGAATTSIVTTATSVPFGILEEDTPATGAQDLTVSTNAANGFVVTVQVDQQLTAGNGGIIHGFSNGDYYTVDQADVWGSPQGLLAATTTWGHWGLTSTDDSVTAGLTDEYASGDAYASASTTPVEVFRHDGPANGTNVGIGTARVGYRAEITALQPAANDYTATLTYVATPVF